MVWANEFDSSIWDTFTTNLPKTVLDKRDITDIASTEIPDAVGIIGGPPCQSWSEAGAGRGLKDERGQLFFEYIRVLKKKKPVFFLAENVSGILSSRHKKSFTRILNSLENAGYNISYKLLNAKDFGVPQDRKRVIVVGYRRDTGMFFEFPQGQNSYTTLKDAIWDIRKNVKPAGLPNKPTGNSLSFPNHEYLVGGFSSMFMSRNRVRDWNEQSFTIQAGGRHAPIHPQAPKMKFIEQDKMAFVPQKKHLYRRLSVRECARIQTFPDSFVFKYKNVADGYKMVGNAVPVKLAFHIAQKIKQDLKKSSLGKVA